MEPGAAARGYHRLTEQPIEHRHEMAGSKATLRVATESHARDLADLIGEGPKAEEWAVATLEQGAHWAVEIYAPYVLTDSELNAAAPLGASPIRQWIIEPLPDEDWVSITQSGLAPVRAGRFVVHGSHDRDRVGFNRYAIEIDAGRAFGTAHHGTTRGCLIAIDRLLSSGIKVRRALDLGTGSGVLAIALARAFRCPVDAVDIDPIAVEVARENCRINGIADVRLSVGDGVRPARAYRPPYDLITANILADPLIRLSPRLSELSAIGSQVIISGLLDGQAREVISAYRARGFCVVNHLHLEGWTTLVLHYRGA